jgi:GNAT superfamily N-acetyltransferase
MDHSDSETARMRLAEPSDLETILPLMQGYYRDDELRFDAVRAHAAMSRLLAEPQWGRVILIEVGAEAVGYVAVCIGFSLEFGGNDAFIDEVFVQPAHRGRGFARQAMQYAMNAAREWGICALHLEVDRDNLAAKRLYASLGYRPRERYHLMTAALEVS